MEDDDGLQNAAGTRLTVGPWRLGRALGEGASGRVCLGKHQKTGRFAAIKVISKDKAQGTTTSIQEAGYDIQQAIEREIVVMNIPPHPNAIQLYEIWDSRYEIYLVLEYVSGGDLLQYMTRKSFLSEKEIAGIFRQLIAGLSHLHQFSIYHRDLKHENLMIDRNGNVKIGDFGMAALQPEGHKFTSACGSPNYAAPEVVQNLPYDGSAADIWSSGVILYGMLAHRLPFDDSDTSTILSRIVCAEYKLPRSVSSEAADLIKRMLELDPEKRIKLEKIFDHPFVTKYQSPNLSLPSTAATAAYTARYFDPHTAMKELQQVDMDIIAKMKVLWMTQDEVALANKVLFQEMSQERLFYNLLLDRHVGGQVAGLSNDVILKSNTLTTPQNLGALHSTSIDEEVSYSYRGASTLTERAQSPTISKRDIGGGHSSLDFKATGDENALEDKIPFSEGRPDNFYSSRLPLVGISEGNAEETPRPPYAGNNDLILPYDLHAGLGKSSIETKIGRLGAIRACLKFLSHQNSYKRKVRKTQSRRSVIFTGSLVGAGAGGLRRLPSMGKHKDTTDIRVLDADTNKNVAARHWLPYS
ncbi:hypothetical protein TWF281_009869 [Arthrobotrys megalospora]